MSTDIDFYMKQAQEQPVRIQGGNDPLKTESLVKGDAKSPVATLLLGDPNQPLTTFIEGDRNKPVTTLLLGDPNQPLTTVVEGDRNKPIATLLLGDPNQPITFSIKDIPQIQLSADVGMKPTRIHNPLHFTFCISLFGLEIVTFALCGEAMTIIEPYHPRKTEVCA